MGAQPNPCYDRVSPLRDQNSEEEWRLRFNIQTQIISKCKTHKQKPHSQQPPHCFPMFIITCLIKGLVLTRWQSKVGSWRGRRGARLPRQRRREVGLATQRRGDSMGGRADNEAAGELPVWRQCSGCFRGRVSVSYAGLPRPLQAPGVMVVWS